MVEAQQLAEALQFAIVLEERARAHWKAHEQDLPERDAALVVVRHATALKRSIEQWFSARAMRAALKTQ